VPKGMLHLSGLHVFSQLANTTGFEHSRLPTQHSLVHVWS